MKCFDEIRPAVLRLHRALVETARLEHERSHGRVSAGSLLDALIHDPAHVWLKPLTAVIVELDADEDETGVTEGTPARSLAALRALLQPDLEGDAFQRRYAAALQESPDVVLAHAEALRALGRAQQREAA